jgi:hypothetical protein
MIFKVIFLIRWQQVEKKNREQSTSIFFLDFEIISIYVSKNKSKIK